MKPYEKAVFTISILVLLWLFAISILVSTGTSEDTNNKIENVNERVNHIVNKYQECDECGCLVNGRLLESYYKIEKISRSYFVPSSIDSIQWVETHCENLVKKEVCRNCYKRLNKAE